MSQPATSVNRDVLQLARDLARQFSQTAAERDERGGTPQAERNALRASGLLRLSIPVELGGLGGSWVDTLATVRELATADSSIAHVYGFHHLLLATTRLFAKAEQWQPWFEQTASNNAFWGNTLNPLDKRTLATRTDSGYRFSGQKSFCSGAIDSDWLIASALDGERLLIAAIPTQRAGITLHNDWNNMGQRQTDSGSATFDNVAVATDELLLDPGPLSTPFSSLRPLLAQLTFVNLFLGISEGAVVQAREYTREEARPWFKADVKQATDDPYVLARYGEFYAGLEAVRVLTERANGLFDQAWNKGTALTAEERAQVALAIGSAKVNATRIGLEVTSRLFEVTGARATSAQRRFDRYWRNLRTQTLHDPVDYRIRELGEWLLNDKPPTPSFYS